jgi:amino acid adenylation domain-containing protein
MFGRRYVRVLRALAGDTAQRVGRVDVLDAVERAELLAACRGERGAVTDDVLTLFARQVARTPEAVAVVDDRATVSYRQLDERSSRLAHQLRGAGVGAESVVAVAAGRGAELVVALIAVWKAGAAYLPIDVRTPPRRVGFMLADAKVSVLLGERAAVDELSVASDVRTVVMDDPVVAAAVDAQPGHGPERSLAADRLAYVIYTSGSTGQPKGVAVTHAGLASYVASVVGRVGFGGEGRRYALLQAVATDLGNTVLLASLVTGGQLHIVDADTVVEPDALRAYLAEHDIDYLKIVPSHLAALAAMDGLDGLLPRRSLVLGGEAAPLGLVEQLLAVPDGPAVFNHYGPTETTIGVATTQLSTDSVTQGRVPIGLPLANTAVYLLDERLNPVPPGVTGEVYVCGAQLARGYLGNAALTATRFVASPFDDGQRMYRTGDLARWSTQGQLQFIGRADDQVKIRGFRVEPGELAAVLSTCPGVAQVAVVARRNTSATATRLVAYVVPEDTTTTLTLAHLRSHAAQQLPEHLLPTAAVVLPALPLTANGKLDRNALPAPLDTPTTPRRTG